MLLSEEMETASMSQCNRRINRLPAGIKLLETDHTAYHKSSHTDPDQQPSIVFNSARACSVLLGKTTGIDIK